MFSMCSSSTKFSSQRSKHFHKPPKKVTEENQKFWKGASICKECFSQFTNRERNNLKQTETPPNENMV
jgi:hypothetical protein